jgi:2,4-dienoyl-CoA reductase-like NADH-dependent reductase (Old Yellow Enzyme family)
MRYPLQIVSRVRAAWPSKPLFVRFSGTEWHPGDERAPSGEWVHWGIEQSSIYVEELKKLGVDYVDVSTGGNYSAQQLPNPILEGYQAPYAQEIKKNHPDILVSAVGMISDPEYAEGLLQGKDGQPPLDAVRLARELLRNPAWPMTAAQKLNVKVKPPNQYERAFGF